MPDRFGHSNPLVKVYCHPQSLSFNFQFQNGEQSTLPAPVSSELFTEHVLDPDAQIAQITRWTEKSDGELWALELTDFDQKVLLKCGNIDEEYCDRHVTKVSRGERIVGVRSSAYLGGACHHDFQFVIGK